MKAVLEGLLFVVGDEGLTINQLSSVLDIEIDEVIKLITELRSDYEKSDRGIRIQFLGNSFKLTTKSEHKDYYRKLTEIGENRKLSQSSLETLAIIAYNEPLTRAKIDEIRGVSSSHLVRKLVAKDFVKELGRSTLPGRPILYGITNEFLDYFGLETKEQLPKIEEGSEITEEELDLYNFKYNEK